MQDELKRIEKLEERTDSLVDMSNKLSEAIWLLAKMPVLRELASLPAEAFPKNFPVNFFKGAINEIAPEIKPGPGEVKPVKSFSASDLNHAPTIGRIVIVAQGGNPCAAVVTKVFHNSTLINVTRFNQDGTTTPLQELRKVSEIPSGEDEWNWPIRE